MPLFGTLHLTLLAVCLLAAVALAVWARKRPREARLLRMVLGAVLVANELVWYTFRYSREGLEPRNFPLQLCDVTLWAAVVACLTLWPPAVEFAYFAGIAGAGMALLTPDLWSPWPSYPAAYFFVVHGGIVAAAVMLVFGRVAPLQPGAVWRAFGMLVGYAVLAGTFNWIFATNHMYLCRKPANASVLDSLGPWPVYLLPGAALALSLFWLLWLPARPVAQLRR